MLNYKFLSSKPSIFRSLTGFEVSEFDSFYNQAQTIYRDYENTQLARPDRKRTVGAESYVDEKKAIFSFEI